MRGLRILPLLLLPLVAQEGPKGLPSELTAFFAGEWTGKGAFASGRPIEAEASFTLDLDGRWLVYRHRDSPPGRYQALGLWGREGAGGLVMTLHDGGGGFRRFEAEGWKEGRVAFLHRAPGGTRQERFRFERQGEAFRMAYEISADGQAWRLVDWLIFQRKG